MDVRICGPLEVLADGEPVALGGQRQRALLAVLVLHRGTVVSSDRLIDELWGADAPATARNVVQGHVSQLRKAFGANGRLETRGHGYVLHLEEGDITAPAVTILRVEADDQSGGPFPNTSFDRVIRPPAELLR